MIKRTSIQRHIKSRIGVIFLVKGMIAWFTPSFFISSISGPLALHVSTSKLCCVMNRNWPPRSSCNETGTVVILSSLGICFGSNPRPFSRRDVSILFLPLSQQVQNDQNEHKHNHVFLANDDTQITE